MTVDIAYGGMWYAIVDAEALGVSVSFWFRSCGMWSAVVYVCTRQRQRQHHVV